MKKKRTKDANCLQTSNLRALDPPLPLVTANIRLRSLVGDYVRPFVVRPFPPSILGGLPRRQPRSSVRRSSVPAPIFSAICPVGSRVRPFPRLDSRSVVPSATVGTTFVVRPFPRLDSRLRSFVGCGRLLRLIRVAEQKASRKDGKRKRKNKTTSILQCAKEVDFGNDKARCEKLLAKSLWNSKPILNARDLTVACNAIRNGKRKIVTFRPKTRPAKGVFSSLNFFPNIVCDSKKWSYLCRVQSLIGERAKELSPRKRFAVFFILKSPERDAE